MLQQQEMCNRRCGSLELHSSPCVQPKEYSHAINAAHTCTRSGSTLVTSVLAVRIALRLWCSRRLLLEMVSQPGEQCQSSDARSSPRSRGLTKLCTKTNVQREPTRMAETFPLSDARHAHKQLPRLPIADGKTNCLHASISAASSPAKRPVRERRKPRRSSITALARAS